MALDWWGLDWKVKSWDSSGSSFGLGLRCNCLLIPLLRISRFTLHHPSISSQVGSTSCPIHPLLRTPRNLTTRTVDVKDASCTVVAAWIAGGAWIAVGCALIIGASSTQSQGRYTYANSNHLQVSLKSKMPVAKHSGVYLPNSAVWIKFADNLQALVVIIYTNQICIMFLRASSSETWPAGWALALAEFGM